MSALGDARFRRLLIGNSVSSFGDSALYLSLGIWAKDLTGSNAAAGAIFLAEGLPCLAAPLAGQLVDRVRRRPLLIAANAAAGVAVLALLMVHSRADLWVMYAVAACYGAASTVIGPAGNGLIKDFLADQDLTGASAAQTTISQGLRIASPLAGAAIYAAFGGGVLAVLDSVTFLAAIGALLSVRVPETGPPAVTGERFRTQLLAGAAHIRRTPLLAQITLSATTAMLVLGFYESVTFAVIAAIGRPASFFGVLISIQATGSILGGLAVTPLIRGAGEARTLGIALALWAAASLIYTIRTPSLLHRTHAIRNRRPAQRRRSHDQHPAVLPAAPPRTHLRRVLHGGRPGPDALDHDRRVSGRYAWLQTATHHRGSCRIHRGHTRTGPPSSAARHACFGAL